MRRLFLVSFALPCFLLHGCTRSAVDVGSFAPDGGNSGGAGGASSNPSVGGNTAGATGGEGGSAGMAAGGIGGLGGADPAGGSAGMAAGGAAGGGILGGSDGFGGGNEVNCAIHWSNNGYCGGVPGAAAGGSAGAIGGAISEGGAAGMAAGGSVGGAIGGVGGAVVGGAGGAVQPPGALGASCSLGFAVGPAQGAFSSSAPECASGICVKPVTQTGATDTSALCTVGCATDADCDGLLRGPTDPTDKRCVSGFTCGVSFVKGELCCRNLCICKDFTGGPITTVPIACQNGGALSCL